VLKLTGQSGIDGRDCGLANVDVALDASVPFDEKLKN
jgi:hypothetical protein